MCKRVLLIAVLALLALPASLAAASGQPTRAPVPDSLYTASFPAGLVCPFPISEAPVVNNEVATTFPAEPNGDVVVMYSGTVIVRIANDATGKSIVINISGPGTAVTHPDGSYTETFRGPTLELFAPGYTSPPGPGALLFDGRTIGIASPTGFATYVSETGAVKLDVCAALA
jgi:hypothetical protein